MLFRPDIADSVGLIINYRCTNQCRHCLYASSPAIKENIDFANIKKILKEIKDYIPQCTIHIGGGEPFLNFDILCSTVEEINRRNIHMEYIETNGRLLVTEEGRKKLKILKSLGLKCILLSISPFHNEFISLNKNRKVYSNITDIFGDTGIFPWHPKYYYFLEQAGNEAPVPFNNYISFFSKQELHYQFKHIIYLHPAGRAAFLFADFFDKYSAEEFFYKNCALECSSGVHAHIDYMGNYCAGFCAGMTIGTDSGFNLYELFKKGIELKKYPILDLVINKSLKELYEYAFDKGFKIRKDKNTYSSPCHLCMHIRTFLYFNYPGVYTELAPNFFYHEIKEKFQWKDLE